MRIRSLVLVLVGGSLALGACKTPGERVSTSRVEGPGAQKRREIRAKNWDKSEGAELTDGPETAGDGAPGALIGVSMESTVGVLLNEVPASMRTRAAQEFLSKPDTFWIERAKSQIRLATYRLVFRNYFYKPGKMQLPLPPESTWQVELVGAPYRETGVQHDTILVKYKLNGTLLTDPASPAIAEPKLGAIGGVWDEPFTFPTDPEMLVQRTGYACMDEAEFPPNSVDSDEADSFYDHECVVEKEPSLEGCHQHLPLPKKTCQQALRDSIGKVDTVLRFTRLPWSAAAADAVRVGPISSTDGADLAVVLEEFHTNRTIYRYFSPDSCEIQEQCITAPGWRKLLQFATTDRNTGSQTLNIGPVDYYITGNGGPTINEQHHIFEYSACHNHYHFTHYGSFSLSGDTVINAKRGFCLQSTNRFSNIEISPLHHPYGGCEYQGVSVGWVDQYKIGLPCQWVDVTDVDTSKKPQVMPLTFKSNPDGFLCEGRPVLDAAGNPVFEPTEFRTPSGEVVSRPKCEFSNGWYDNNVHSYDVTVSKPGEGVVTGECTRGQVGELRNCGIANSNKTVACTPGASTTLRCSTASGSAPQVVRICDYSAKLKTGIPCRWEEGLATKTIEDSGTVSFTCPAARDAQEPGGKIAVYSGAVLTSDQSAAVTCTVQ